MLLLNHPSIISVLFVNIHKILVLWLGFIVIDFHSTFLSRASFLRTFFLFLPIYTILRPMISFSTLKMKEDAIHIKGCH